MLPLTDGAGYKLFSALNVFAYRWCDYKLFGVNILSPPSWWGFLFMRIERSQSVLSIIKENHENTIRVLLSHKRCLF